MEGSWNLNPKGVGTTSEQDVRRIEKGENLIELKERRNGERTAHMKHAILMRFVEKSISANLILGHVFDEGVKNSGESLQLWNDPIQVEEGSPFLMLGEEDEFQPVGRMQAYLGAWRQTHAQVFWECVESKRVILLITPIVEHLEALLRNILTLRDQLDLSTFALNDIVKDMTDVFWLELENPSTQQLVIPENASRSAALLREESSSSRKGEGRSWKSFISRFKVILPKRFRIWNPEQTQEMVITKSFHRLDLDVIEEIADPVGYEAIQNDDHQEPGPSSSLLSNEINLPSTAVCYEGFEDQVSLSDFFNWATIDELYQDDDDDDTSENTLISSSQDEIEEPAKVENKGLATSTMLKPDAEGMKLVAVVDNNNTSKCDRKCRYSSQPNCSKEDFMAELKSMKETLAPKKEDRSCPLRETKQSTFSTVPVNLRGKPPVKPPRKRFPKRTNIEVIQEYIDIDEFNVEDMLTPLQHFLKQWDTKIIRVNKTLHLLEMDRWVMPESQSPDLFIARDIFHAIECAKEVAQHFADSQRIRDLELWEMRELMGGYFSVTTATKNYARNLETMKVAVDAGLKKLKGVMTYYTELPKRRYESIVEVGEVAITEVSEQ